MLSNHLTRVFARVVLASYLTQLLTPMVQASEGGVLTLLPTDPLAANRRLDGRHTRPSLKEIQRPTTRTPKFVAPPIDEERARSEAEAYQYKLRLKTVNSKAERFQIKLSRKEKGSDGSFTRLHTAMVNRGKVSTTSSIAQDTKDDTLLNLFKYASFENFSDNFAWNLSGFKIVVSRDGSVLLDQASTPLLSIYDLVLKTSGELLLQSLGVAELTLQSPKTQIRGAVVTNHLHMDHDVTNEGRLQVRKVSGQGTLINHSTFDMEGTEETPAVLGVRQVINKKNGPKEAKMESSYLHISSENHSFLNGEGAEFRVRENLTVDDSLHAKASFTNMGSTYLPGATFNRAASNAGFWQACDMTANEKPFTNKTLATLKILDRLTALSLSNEGDIACKNLIRATGGKNTGKIHGENLELLVEELMTNTGDVTVKDLTGRGMFQNKGILELTGTQAEPSKVRVKELENGTDGKGASVLSDCSKIKGSHITVTAENEKFITHDNSEMAATRLVFEKPIKKLFFKEQLALKKVKLAEEANRNALIETEPKPNHPIIKNTELPVKLSFKEQLALKKAKLAEEALLNRNPGASNTTEIPTPSSVPFELRGNIHTDELLIYHPNILNSGVIDTSSLSLPRHAPMKENGVFRNAKKATLRVKKSTQAEIGSFQNDGKMVTQGKFSQLTGEFKNTGLWDHTGDIDLGKTTLKNEEKGTINWKQGQWSYFHAGEDLSYSIANHGLWILDQITSRKLLPIYNYGQLHLKRGVLDFELLRNSGTLVLSQGQYCIDDFQNMDSSNKSGIVKVLEHDWTLTDDAANIKATLEAETKSSHLIIKNFDARGKSRARKF